MSSRRDPPHPRPKQEANRLYLTYLDMEQAEAYLHALDVIEKLPDFKKSVHLEEAADALLFSAIIVYARPFVLSKSVGYADQLAATRRIFRGHPELKARHKKIVDLRQKGAAHMDWDMHGTWLMLDERNGTHDRFAWRPHFRTEIDIVEFWELIDHVRGRVRAAQRALDDQIVKDPEHADMRLWRRSPPA